LKLSWFLPEAADGKKGIRHRAQISLRKKLSLYLAKHTKILPFPMQSSLGMDYGTNSVRAVVPSSVNTA
jgi:hypothetical protein